MLGFDTEYLIINGNVYFHDKIPVQLGMPHLTKISVDTHLKNVTSGANRISLNIFSLKLNDR